MEQQWRFECVANRTAGLYLYEIAFENDIFGDFLRDFLCIFLVYQAI